MLGVRYQEVWTEVKEASEAVGCPPPQLIAVSKYSSPEEILEAYRQGCRTFGENRVQDLLEKIPVLPADIQWHFIGTLQKNKVRKVVGKVALIHSVDHPALAEKISEVSRELSVKSAILLQANCSGELSKHGLTPHEWLQALDQVVQLPGIEICGVMTMAPLTDDQEAIVQTFQMLKMFFEELRSSYAALHSLKHLSMGMSHDFPLAIQEGATLLRIGSAIFTGPSNQKFPLI